MRHCLGAFGGGHIISFGVTLDTNKDAFMELEMYIRVSAAFVGRDVVSLLRVDIGAEGASGRLQARRGEGEK